jgi:hypothetical protein
VKIREIESEPIVGRLLTAFADTEPPGTKAFPSYPDFEAMAEVQVLRKRIWDDLEIEELLDHATALNWLSAEALRYYAPAYFAVAIAFPEVAGDVAFALLQNFVPPGRRATRGDRFREMAEGLTTTQKAVIRDCLSGLGLYLDAELSRSVGRDKVADEEGRSEHAASPGDGPTPSG